MFVFRLMLLGVLGFSLAGCSGLAKWFNGEDDYRIKEAQLAKELEMPPEFVRRGAAPSALTQAIAKPDLTEVKTLPSYQVEGLRIQSNLVERWLELDNLTAVEAWQGFQTFLNTQGFSVDEARLDIGLIKTNYIARKELAPVAQELSALSRVFNSWRPELVTGIYDRFSFQLIEDDKQGKIKIFVRHHMMAADSSGDITKWTLRPYDPMFESIVLYQALVFFGASQTQAIDQLQTAKYYQEITEGEELAGLILSASLSQSWDYLQAMIYRANWQVKMQTPNVYEIWLATPQNVEADRGFFARLFAKNKMPETVRLKLTRYEDAGDATLLSLAVEETQPPLTAEQRRQVLIGLGLLTE